MLVIGLTGSIGSGKTTVSKLFAVKQIPTLNADNIARQLLEVNTCCYYAVVDYFTHSILNPNKTINRAKLRELIFNDVEKRRWLEQLLHPKIKQQIIIEIDKLKQSQLSPPYCLVEIPLLNDKANYPMLDRILFIDCDKPLQINRVEQRDNSPHQLIESIIASQPSNAARRKLADDIIRNTSTLEALHAKVDELDLFYRGLKCSN